MYYRMHCSRLRVCLALVITLFLAFLTTACARRTPEEIEELAGQLFLELTISANDNLNLFEGAPCSLALCLYQLSERSAFDVLRDGDGDLGERLETLMKCDVWDDSVLGRQREFFNPGEKRVITLERRKGVKHLLIVAGFNGAELENSTRLIELPSVTLKSKYQPKHQYVIMLRGHTLEVLKVGR